MKSNILLIKLPQTALGQRLPSHNDPSQSLLHLQSLLSNMGVVVEILDADFYAMNLFSLLRTIRSHAPAAVWVVEQSDVCMSKILRTLLLMTMPQVVWLNESDKFMPRALRIYGAQ